MRDIVATVPEIVVPAVGVSQLLALQKFPRYLPESNGLPYVSQTPTPLATPPRTASPGMVAADRPNHSPLAENDGVNPENGDGQDTERRMEQADVQTSVSKLQSELLTGVVKSSSDSFDLSRGAAGLPFDFARKGPMEARMKKHNMADDAQEDPGDFVPTSLSQSGSAIPRPTRQTRRSSVGVISFNSRPLQNLSSLNAELSWSETLLNGEYSSFGSTNSAKARGNYFSIITKRDIFLGGIDSLNIAVDNHRRVVTTSANKDCEACFEDRIDSNSDEDSSSDSGESLNPKAEDEESQFGENQDLEASSGNSIEVEAGLVVIVPVDSDLAAQSVKQGGESDAESILPLSRVVAQGTTVTAADDTDAGKLASNSNREKLSADRFSSRANSAPIRRPATSHIAILTSQEKSVDQSSQSTMQLSPDQRSEMDLEAEYSSPSRKESLFHRMFHSDSPRNSAIVNSQHFEQKPSPLFHVNGRDDHGNPTTYQVVQYPQNSHHRDPARRLDTIMAKIFSIHHHHMNQHGGHAGGSTAKSGQVGDLSQSPDLESNDVMAASAGGQAGGSPSPNISPILTPCGQVPTLAVSDSSEILPPSAIHQSQQHHPSSPFGFLKLHSHDSSMSSASNSPSSDAGLFKDLLTNRHRRSHSNNGPASNYGSPASSTPEDSLSPKITQRSLSEASMQEKYGKVDEVLGKGASATVRLYHKHDEFNGSDKLYAVKEFRKRRRGELPRDYVKKVVAEFCISSSMHHENVIETVDLVQDEHDRWCEVMEYMPGGDLYSRISQNLLTDFDEINCFFKQLLAGVNYIHSVGVAHRDLKPENLLLDGESRILKIADFGVSEVFKTCFEKSSRKAKGVCGSEPYIAPEEWEENAEYDGSKVDIWACGLSNGTPHYIYFREGIIYYTMLYNSVPWRVARTSDSHYQDYVSHRKPEYQTGYSPFDRLHPGPRNLFYRILEPDPSKRPAAQNILDDPWLDKQEFCRARNQAGSENSEAVQVHHSHHPNSPVHH